MVRASGADPLIETPGEIVGAVAAVLRPAVSAQNPPGWPQNSPVWANTLDSYRMVWRCHRRLTPRYRQLVADASSSKRVHHLKSASEIAAFLEAVREERERD